MTRPRRPGPSGDPDGGTREPTVDAGRPTPAPAGAALRVVTFNIRTGIAPEHRPARLWPRRRSAVAAVLAGLDADVIGLQEVHGFQLARLARALPGHTIAGSRPRGRWTGERCPVLVRTERLRVRTEQTAWFVEQGLDPHALGVRMTGAHHPRVVSRVVLTDTRTDRDLVVLNTHLATEAAPRRRAAEHLAAAVDPADDTIVFGDFNAAAGAADLAPLVAVGLTRAPTTGSTFHRWSGTSEGVAIDHVFLSAGWEVLATRIDRSRPDGRLPSDHWPVVVDIGHPVRGRR